MKKLITFTLLCFYSISFAQDESFIRKTIVARSMFNEREILADFKHRQLLRQERIYKAVKEQGVAYNYISNEGVYNELVDIYPDGTPLYYQSSNSKAGQLANITTIQKGGKYNLNLTGKNVLIGVFDATPTFKKHNEFRDRASQIHIKSEVVSDNAPLSERRSFQFAQEHATHVTGTIFAKGVEPEAKGLAPDVELYSFDWKSDELNMHKIAKIGALTSNHSYGTTVILNGELIIDQKLVGIYDWKAESFDRVTFFNKNYLPVIAAGNDHEYAELLNKENTEYNNLVGISVAKNTLVVGSINQIDGELNNNNVNIASSSNYGPTKDFRIKPDLVAKGVALYSTINDYSRTDDYILRTDKYTYLSGTSMAAPVVTSLVALLQEWAIKSFRTPLKASSIKGVLIHTAYELNKIIDQKTQKVKHLNKGPNAIYGWGAIDADKAMTLLNNLAVNKSYIIESELASMTTKKYIINNVYEDNELEATLVWTDPANVFDYSYVTLDIAKVSLVNDLDMRIKNNNIEFYPWALAKDIYNPVAIEKDNDVDNVERITRKKVSKGETVLTITYKGEIVLGKQEYSLIISSKEPVSIIEIVENKSDLVAIERPVDNHRKEKVNALDITVWPNPVQDIIYLEYDSDKFNIYEVQVYDINGKLLKRINNLEEKSISLVQLSKGRYLIKFITNEGIIVKHIVKK